MRTVKRLNNMMRLWTRSWAAVIQKKVRKKQWWFGAHNKKDRANLQAEIQAYQKEISVLNDTRAPLAAQVRKVEAEVGPLKFIAELFYEEVDTQFLDKTVRWVIILIVIVFDPLAVILLIAANIGMSKTKIEEQQIEQEKDTQQEIESRARLLKELTGKIRGGTIMIDKNQIREM